MDRALDEWIDALDEIDSEIRLSASEKIIQFGEQAFSALLAAARSPHRRKSRYALTLLIQMKSSIWIDYLFEFLTSPNLLVGEAAVHGIENHPEPYIDTLIRALPLAHRMVQIHIVRVLGETRSRRVVDPLMNHLLQTDNAPVRYTIIEALGKIGDPKAAPVIALFVHDHDHHVRTYSVKALGKLHHE